MKIQYIGHAGFIVTLSGGTRILIDPFFHAAFSGSWFPYPDNSFFEEHLLKKYKFDYLYISHTHEDHFDVKFLKQFDKSVTVLCPNYRSRALERKFREQGFNNLVLMDHRQEREFDTGWDKFKATALLDVSHKEDSGLLVDADECKFLDLNDCNTKLSELPRGVTILAAQFSGAMWYPNCYHYQPEEMQAKVDEVREQLIDTLALKIKTIRPQVYIPCAGPPVFLDPLLQPFNNRARTIFPAWEDVAAEFHKRCYARIAQLQVEDFIDGAGQVQRMYAKLDTDVAAYAERRKAEWQVARRVNVETQTVAEYFGRLAHRNKHALKEPKTFWLETESRSWTVRLDLADRVKGEDGQAVVWERNPLAEGFHYTAFILDCGACAVMRSPNGSEGFMPDDPTYFFSVPGWLLSDIVTGRTGWEEALLSMRVILRREPDVYDSTLMGLLRYGNEETQTRQMVKDEQCEEMVTRDGRCYQRFCPHAGEDLKDAPIDGDIIECPRHHWKWDLRTGECVKGGNVRLRTCPQ